MWINIAKSFLLMLIISIGVSVLSHFGAHLFNTSVGLGVGVNLSICLSGLAAYVLLAKLWFARQRSRFLDLVSVGAIPVLTGLPLNSSSNPPYGPTLTLDNSYLAPLENIARHFSTTVPSNHYLLILEVLVPPLLMWVGLVSNKTSVFPNPGTGDIRKPVGIGSISLLLFACGTLFSSSFGHRVSYGDHILKFFGLNPWSNGDTGLHYTVFYSLAFYMPALILGYKFKDDLGAKAGMILSLIMIALLLLLTPLLVVV